MKREILGVLIAFFAFTMNSSSAIAQKKARTGQRMEICSADENKNVFSIFTYLDEDGTEGFYLSLGRESQPLKDIFDSGTLLGDMTNIRETCIWLGDDYDGTLEALEDLLDDIDDDIDSVKEYKGRELIGSGEKLGEPTTSIGTVKKRTLGGKRLVFAFTSGNKTVESSLTKSVVKELRAELKIYRKLHKK